MGQLQTIDTNSHHPLISEPYHLEKRPEESDIFHVMEDSRGNSYTVGLHKVDQAYKLFFKPLTSVDNCTLVESYLTLCSMAILTQFVEYDDTKDRQTFWVDKWSPTFRPMKTDALLKSLGVKPQIRGKLKAKLEDMSTDIVHGTAYLPQPYSEGVDPLVTSEGFHYLNSYKPSPIAPIHGAKDLGNFHELLHGISGGDIDIKVHITHWLAHLVQRPHIKMMHGLLLGSKQHGLGKGTLIRIMGEILGKQNVNNVTPQDITNQKQDWASHKVLVAVDEVKDVSSQTMNKLKTWVTEETKAMDLKYSHYGTQTNYANFIFTTNERMSLRLTEEDRRYFVVYSEVKPRGGFFEELNHWLEHNDGYAKILGYLLSIDLDDAGFNPKGNAPDTPARQALIRSSVSNFEGWLMDILEESPPVLTMSNLKEVIAESAYSGKAANTKYLRSILENNGWTWPIEDNGKPKRFKLKGKLEHPLFSKNCPEGVQEMSLAEISKTHPEWRINDWQEGNCIKVTNQSEPSGGLDDIPW